MKLPESYKGVVVSSNAGDMLRESHPSKDNLSDDGDEEEPTTEVGIMEEQASFEKLMIWGHEVLPNDGVDPYVRGVDEWIAFAEQVCFVDCRYCHGCY